MKEFVKEIFQIISCDVKKNKLNSKGCVILCQMFLILFASHVLESV